jgi:phosphatidylglycerol:prolipoprotein diacylglycerol transferase
MLTYPNIDPIAFTLGPLSVRWYGLTYLLGFTLAFAWCLYRRRTQSLPWEIETISDLFFYCALGVIFGGTIGYLLFYHPGQLWADPLSALKFWEPGRSFHGGLMGVLLALFIFARVHRRSFWAVADFLMPSIPLGLAAGRLGNFLNAELWGRTTDMPWGMVFPYAGSLPRHPSQLYEFLLEGVLLFIILALYNRKPRTPGYVSGMFLIWYGCFRIMVEFFREPDVSHGFIFGEWVTMGQFLSFPMIISGLFLLFSSRNASLVKE